MAQRVLALLAAVGLVLVAIVVRAAIDDGGDGAGRSADGGDGELEVYCAEDLQAACDGLADEGVTVTYQAAAATAALIAEGSPQLAGVDGWVTSSPWIELLDARAPDVLAAPVVLATTSVVVAVDADRTEAVRTLCANQPIWRCLGDDAGASWADLGSGGSPAWGALKTGLPAPDSAAGLGVLASVASGFFGRTDFASNDFELEGFAAWLSALAAPSGAGEADPTGVLATVQGKYTAVGDLAAAAAGRGVDVLEPSPAIEISAVLVSLPGGDDLPDPAAAREGMAASGWVPSSDDALIPTLKPGVMAALHELWTEVTG